jgi:hypothetical protein
MDISKGRLDVFVVDCVGNIRGHLFVAIANHGMASLSDDLSKIQVKSRCILFSKMTYSNIAARKG